MLKIIIFCLMVYTVSFVIVYKKNLITKPYEFLMTILGLKDSLVCMICTPFWIAGILSTLNIFVLSQMGITPSLVLFGEFNCWLEYAGGIFIDMFSTASIVFIMDQILLFFTENRKLDVTILKENTVQLLHD